MTPGLERLLANAATECWHDWALDDADTWVASSRRPRRRRVAMPIPQPRRKRRQVHDDRVRLLSAIRLMRGMPKRRAA